MLLDFRDCSLTEDVRWRSERGETVVLKRNYLRVCLIKTKKVSEKLSFVHTEKSNIAPHLQIMQNLQLPPPTPALNHPPTLKMLLHYLLAFPGHLLRIGNNHTLIWGGIF